MTGDSELWSLGSLSVILLPRAPRGTEITGVCRGLGLLYAGTDITGEGMGIGGVVLRRGNVTYFPLTCRGEVCGRRAVVTFELNGLSRRFIGPLDVTELHRRVREGMTFLYMRGGRAASTFRWLMRMRSHLMRTEYKEVEKIESCSLMYAFKNNTIEVRVLRENRVGKLIVANELSGALFDLLLHDGKPFRLGPWTRCSSRSPVLLSSKLGIHLNFTLPKDVEVFAGREVMPPRLNWAGVDLVMNEGLAETSYSVSVDLDSQQRARG